MYRVTAILVLLGLANQLAAQDSFPQHLIGFLNARQHVGVSTRPDTGTLFVVFRDQTDMQIHRDAEKMDVEELRKKYPKVEEQALEIIRLQSNDSGGNTATLPPKAKVEIGRTAPMGYAKVLNVGNDYALLEFDDGHRAAYSSYHIARIAWDDGKPNLYLADESDLRELGRTR